MINSIQYLRAIAALYVVLLHTSDKLELQNSFTNIGVSGVDLFFIISGFIITYIEVNNNTSDWKEFILKRFIRIIPLYWILTIFFQFQYCLLLTCFKRISLVLSGSSSLLFSSHKVKHLS